jgi:transcriptional regulator with XRE-family HTH domain
MNREFNEKVGNAIKNARRDRNLTQKELGNLVGLTENQIQKYETYVRNISLENIYLICKALNLSLDKLLGL